MFYTASYLTWVVTLVLWLFFKDTPIWRNPLGKAFLISAIAYFISLFIQTDASIAFKTMILGRDVLLMFGLAFIMNTFSRSAVLFSLLFIGAAWGVYYKYYEVLYYTFEKKPLSQSLPSLRSSTDNTTLSEGEFLVEFKEGISAEQIKSILHENYQIAFQVASETITQLDNVYIVDVPNDKIKERQKEIAAHEGVNWVEYNEIVKVPNDRSTDTYAPSGTAYSNDAEIGKVWAFDVMKIHELHQFLAAQKYKPAKIAKIAILDTGIDSQHEDLKENYVSTNKKYDDDANSHGTHCAGIAAAVSNNQKGIASLSPDNSLVRVTSIRVLGGNGSGTERGIIKGIIEAADSGADVISMSLGGRSTDARQQAYREAIDYANKKGAIVVVAAGNEGSDARNVVPASIEGVITVSAIDNQLNRARFSNEISALKMGVAAPGVNIFSTMPNNRYAAMNGTSMATPYVAGVLGMMKAFKPDMDTKTAFELLKETGIETQDTKLTGRLVQPLQVLKTMLKK